MVPDPLQKKHKAGQNVDIKRFTVFDGNDHIFAIPKSDPLVQNLKVILQKLVSSPTSD